MARKIINFYFVITTYLLYLIYKSILRKDLVQAVKFKNVTIEYQRLKGVLGNLLSFDFFEFNHFIIKIASKAF